jgi:hypothetical protein
LTVGGGGEPGDSDIQTDLPTGGGQLHGLLLDDNDDIPPAPLALAPQRLYPADDLPVGFNLHLADTLKVRRGPPTLDVAPAGTVTVHRVDRVPAGRGLEARIASPAASPHSLEENLEGAVQAAQGLLLAGERPPALAVPVSPADLDELRGLVAVADCHAAAPSLPALFQGGVVQLAMGFQQGSGVLLLSPGGISAELVGPMHDPIVAVRCDSPRDGYEVRGGGASIRLLLA